MDDRAHLAGAPVESLEHRILLSSAARSGGKLRIYGDEGVNNVIVVGLTSNKDDVNVTVNGQSQTISGDDLEEVRIFGADGDDTIRIDQTNGKFKYQTKIFCGSGNDLVYCGEERDYVEGEDGSDTIRAGNGRNLVLGDGGNDHIIGGDQRDLIVGGPGADMLEGGESRDQITGDNGDDIIIGGDGSDLIYAGRGNDYVDGQAGKDVIFGQDGNDTVFGGDDRDEIFGNAGDDSLSGDGDSDTLWGGAGTDILRGGAGGGETHHGEIKDVDVLMQELVPKY